MEYVLLLRDKELIPTLPHPINQGENNADCFKIIVPKSFEKLHPTFQVILPNATGKTKSCTYDDGVYKDNWITITIPISSLLTSYSGILQMWLIFFSSEGQDATMKTNICSIYVNEHKGFSEVIGDDEYKDIGQVVSELQVTVRELYDKKADSIVLDNETKTLNLKSGDVSIASIVLPDDVLWEVME